MRRAQRTTPEGEHRPVLLDEVLAALAPQPGDTVVDCTTGWGGHAVELLQRLVQTGFVILRAGLQLDYGAALIVAGRVVR